MGQRLFSCLRAAARSNGDKTHRYIFTLYALGVDDVQKAGQLPKTGSAAVYPFVLNKGLGKQLLGKASFTVRYRR